MTVQPPVRIGARASALSQAQSRQMQARIAAALGVLPGPSADEVEAAAPLVLITTTGDRIQDRRLLEAGGKGLFVKELEEALLDGRIDCAVHSFKDVPTLSPPGLVIAAIPEREDPRDAFISPAHARLIDLPQGARLGTASLRRQAQALSLRPDLDVVMLRGNVDTRLVKLERGEADAILLALAGLRRLGLDSVVREALDPLAAPPAPGQGALAIQTRVEDAESPWLAALRHAPTALAVAAERGAMEALDGSCRTAIGAHAFVEAGQFHLVVEALSPDGAFKVRRRDQLGVPAAQAPEALARELGLALGRQVREEAADRIVFG
jgi:hydroxymethylbilane synthase